MTTPADTEQTADASTLGARHRGREVALQVLYAIDLYAIGRRDARIARSEGDGARDAPAPPLGEIPPIEVASLPDDPVDAAALVFDRVTDHFDVPRSAVAFARALVTDVARSGEALDEIIGLHARNWRVSRMAAVDRNVLRLAVYELRDTETPVPVVIDEAVDLARRFGSDTSPSFVNGVLDAVAREVRAA